MHIASNILRAVVRVSNKSSTKKMQDYQIYCSKLMRDTTTNGKKRDLKDTSGAKTLVPLLSILWRRLTELKTDKNYS